MVSMALKSMSNEELVKGCIEVDKEMKEKKKTLDEYKAEAQARGLELMEDQNIKFIKFYGNQGSVSITDSQSLEVLNMDKLKEAIGEGIAKEKIKEMPDIKYKFDTKLEKALKAIFTGDFTFEYSLEEFLDEMSVKPDEKQKKLLLKKIKGDYKQDKNTLLTVLGYMSRGQDEKDVEAPDFDVELWYIYKIKNGELIKAFLPEEEIDFTIEAIRKCIIVETKTGISIDYEKED